MINRFLTKIRGGFLFAAELQGNQYLHKLNTQLKLANYFSTYDEPLWTS